MTVYQQHLSKLSHFGGVKTYEYVILYFIHDSRRLSMNCPSFNCPSFVHRLYPPLRLFKSHRWLPDAAMIITATKSKAMHIHKTTQKSATTVPVVAKLNLVHKCESCAREFTKLRGLKMHMARWCDGPVRSDHA